MSILFMDRHYDVYTYSSFSGIFRQAEFEVKQEIGDFRLLRIKLSSGLLTRILSILWIDALELADVQPKTLRVRPLSTSARGARLLRF